MAIGIKRIIGAPEFGGAKPVWVVANDNNTYLLKFRQDYNKKDIAIFCEYLSYRLIEELRIEVNIPQRELIELQDEDLFLFEKAYREGVIEEESLSYARNSIGINLGIKKISNVQKAEGKFPKKIKRAIRSIDNYVLNKDRYKDNPNILYDGESGKFYAIDFGLGLLETRVYEEMIKGNEHIYTQPLCSLCNCNVTLDEFYLFREDKQLKIIEKEDINQIKDIILSIIDEMPEEWMPLQYRDEIADVISYRVVNGKIWENEKCPFEIFG